MARDFNDPTVKMSMAKRVAGGVLHHLENSTINRMGTVGAVIQNTREGHGFVNSLTSAAIQTVAGQAASSFGMFGQIAMTSLESNMIFNTMQHADEKRRMEAEFTAKKVADFVEEIDKQTRKIIAQTHRQHSEIETDLNKRMNELQDTMDVFNKRLGVVEPGVKDLNVHIERLDGYFNSLEQRYGRFDGDIVKLEERVHRLEVSGGNDPSGGGSTGSGGSGTPEKERPPGLGKVVSDFAVRKVATAVVGEQAVGAVASALGVSEAGGTAARLALNAVGGRLRMAGLIAGGVIAAGAGAASLLGSSGKAQAATPKDELDPKDKDKEASAWNWLGGKDKKTKKKEENAFSIEQYVKKLFYVESEKDIKFKAKKIELSADTIVLNTLDLKVLDLMEKSKISQKEATDQSASPDEKPKTFWQRMFGSPENPEHSPESGGGREANPYYRESSPPGRSGSKGSSPSARGSSGGSVEPAEGGILPDGSRASPGTERVLDEVKPDGRPASVRYNNPGAQYPNQYGFQYGMTGFGYLEGGKHKIGKYPTAVHGQAHNFDTFGRLYVGLTLGEAVKKWRGGNGDTSVPKGFDANQRVTAEMLKDKKFMIDLFRGMAEHEAGKGKAPKLTDEQYEQAYKWYQRGGAYDSDEEKETKRKYNDDLKKKSGNGATLDPGQTKAPTDEEQKKRPDYWKGKLHFGDEEYKFGTGAPHAYNTDMHRGSVPYGEFNIEPGLHYGPNKRLAGDSFGVESMFDKKWGTSRNGVLFHSARDLDRMYSAGCFAISRDQWPKFRAQMLEAMKKNGPMTVRVLPNGDAYIYPKGKPPPGLVERDSPKSPDEFMKENDRLKKNPEAEPWESTPPEKVFSDDDVKSKKEDATPVEPKDGERVFDDSKDPDFKPTDPGSLLEKVIPLPKRGDPVMSEGELKNEYEKRFGLSPDENSDHYENWKKQRLGAETRDPIPLLDGLNKDGVLLQPIDPKPADLQPGYKGWEDREPPPQQQEEKKPAQESRNYNDPNKAGDEKSRFIDKPEHDPEAEPSSPGSDGYGSQKIPAGVE